MLEEMLRCIPKGCNVDRWISSWVKAQYQQHLEYLEEVARGGGPFYKDAVLWLEENSQLARQFLEEDYTIDGPTHGYLKRMACVDIKREALLLRHSKPAKPASHSIRP